MALRAGPPLLQQALPRDVVARPALVRMLDRSPPGGLALVVASAGSGKSILLQQWARGVAGDAIAAIELAPRHDDAVVLARDLTEAIRAAVPELADDPGLVQPPATRGGHALGDTVVEGLLSRLAALPRPLVLVFEDAHVLENVEVVADLGALLTRLPGTVRAVVTTRRDLPWSVRHLRLEGRLVELRGSDLAFDDAEAHRLLVAVSGRELAGDQAAALRERTGGWAAGLQLAAISLQHTADVGAFVASFAGTDRLIADYLVGEVLDAQDAAVRRFLLRTSVLDELTVELCDAVTGDGNARAMLDELSARSLFLVALDRTSERYRYHPLFAEVLTAQRRAEAPAEAADLHGAAAQWLIAHGRSEEAVPHLIAAGERLRAFEVISAVGHRLYERGESATLVRWLSALDTALPDPPAAVTISLLAALLAADEGTAAMEVVRRLSKRSDLSPGERAAAEGLSCSLVIRDYPPALVHETAERVLALLPAVDPDEVVDFLGVGGRDSIEVMVLWSSAIARFLQGDAPDARRRLELLLTRPGVGYALWRIYALSTLALVRAWAGHSTEALQLADAAIESARSVGLANHQGVTHARLAAAMACLDRGDAIRAARELEVSGLQVRRRPTSVTYADIQRALEARLASVREGPDAAFAVLAKPAVSSQEPPILVDANAALRARLLLGRGDVASARALVDSAGESADLRLARIDVALAEGRPQRARELLAGWRPDADDRHATIGRRLRVALVADADGDHRTAMAALRATSSQAGDEQVSWPFLMAPGLARLLRRGPTHLPGVLDEALLRVARRLDGPSSPGGPLGDPLTERELAVLQYLPARLQYQDIAAELYVSLNTLKSHLRGIFRKLGVAGRDEAVAKARELGLL